MCTDFEDATFLKVQSRSWAGVWFELVNDCFRLEAALGHGQPSAAAETNVHETVLA